MPVSLDAGNTVYDRRYKTGNWYSNNSHAGATSTVSASLNAARFVPITFTRKVLLDRIGCEVTTTGGVGCLLRLGIYKDSGYGEPDELLLDAGTVNGNASTGTKAITISQIVGRGLYWLVVAGQGGTAATIRAFNVTGSGQPNITSTSQLTTQIYQQYIQSSGVSGALPSTVSGSVNSNSPPRIQVRIG